MSYAVKQWHEGAVAFEGNAVGWKMQDGEFRPLMSDALEDLFHEGLITESVVRATEVAREYFDAKCINEYVENRANRTPEQVREEQFELQAAFGPGAKVVDIFTGETTDTPAEVEVESDELNETGGWSAETLASMKRSPNLNVSDDAIAKIGKSIVRQAKAKTSKKAQVAAIIESYGSDVFFTLVNHRAQIIERIVDELGVTKANAGVYVYNYKKARGL